MTFRINVLSRANRDVNHFMSWIAHERKSPQGAVSWYQAYESALERLAYVADQQPLAPENEFADFEVRHMAFKTRRGRPYRLRGAWPAVGPRLDRGVGRLVHRRLDAAFRDTLI